MSYWNYRVIKTEDYYDGYIGESFSIHEVYYDDDDNIVSWSEKEMAPYGESYDELREDLIVMLRAVDNAPVLNREDLPGGKADG